MGALVWLAMVVAPGTAAAQATVLAEPPAGAPERSSASAPALAPTPRQGGSVLVYASPVEPSGDQARRNEIRSRTIDAQGRPVGESKLVAEAVPGTSSEAPRIAYDPKLDSFLVIWRELRGPVGGGHTNAGRIRVRRIGSDGAPSSPPVTVASLTPELTGADVEFDALRRRYAVAWSSGARVKARLLDAQVNKAGKVRVLGGRASEVTVGATRGSFLVAWVHTSGRLSTGVLARTIDARDSSVGPRTRIALPRERGATVFVVSHLDLAYDTRRRRLALAYSAWWDTDLGEGDTEVNVQRLTPRGARIGAPTWLDVELNSENLDQTRIAYDRTSDSFRVIWWYEQIPSGPACRDTQIRTGSISGAWKARPPQNAISQDSDPGGPPQPNAGGARCQVPPEQPAIAPAGDGGWLAAWTREPYVLGLRLGS